MFFPCRQSTAPEHFLEIPPSSCDMQATSDTRQTSTCVWAISPALNPVPLPVSTWINTLFKWPLLQKKYGVEQVFPPYFSRILPMQGFLYFQINFRVRLPAFSHINFGSFIKISDLLRFRKNLFSTEYSSKLNKGTFLYLSFQYLSLNFIIFLSFAYL